MKSSNAFALLLVTALGWCNVAQSKEPRSVEDAVVWLRDKSKEMIHASQRTMTDGVAAFPPQVGGGYEAFWLRDYDYMLEGCVEDFSDKELTDACMVFLRAQRADGAGVDCVKFDGTPIYMPGYGTMGENPVADGSQFMIDVAWHTYGRTRDRVWAKRIADQLVKAMEAVPRNPKTGLVHIKSGGYDRCPYGFTDSVRKEGDELFSSLLYVEASRRLADLLDAAERPDEARKWRAEADRLVESIRKVFWDGTIGLFRAATVRCNEPDIWGSAFAVYLDVATKEQSLAIARYFQQHYGEIVARGQVRHLPDGVYWEAACEKDTYQNGGFWATPTGWFVYTLDLVDPQLADRTVLELVRDFRRNGVREWFLGEGDWEKAGVPNYTANATLPISGIRKMLERRKAAGLSPIALPVTTRELANSTYHLSVVCVADEVEISLDDKLMGFRVAEGPYVYRAQRQDGRKTTHCDRLSDVSVGVNGNRLTIRGQLAGLDVEHTFELPSDRPILEERIVLHNRTRARVALSKLEMGLVRTATDGAGQVLPELAGDRFVAVPFRARPDDAKPYYDDFSTTDLIQKKGYELHVKCDQQSIRIPADQRQSDGWAWSHGPYTLGIFKFDQENLQWSVLAVDKEGGGRRLRFGGASMIDGEPSDLGRMEPGQTVRLGMTRYQTVRGGHDAAMYAFRALLNEKGCHFPKGFNPPVHWEQLYDMEGAWNDRPHMYTKAILEKEAEKAVAYGCEALYLDPGWDTDFATFLWGEQWLGPRKTFVEEMRSKYGLKVSLHTPLAPWMSAGEPMGGDSAPSTYPPEASRKAPRVGTGAAMVPAIDHQQRNLALLPGAKANASSVWADGALPIHQSAHLNDGWYGNRKSWIAKTPEAWAEIDLGDIYTISRVRLSNDRPGEYSDRKPASYRILVATKYDADSSAAAWKPVADVSGEPLLGAREFSFAPCRARWVRVQVLRSESGEPRLDEIEIYEDRPLAEKDAEAWETQARRGPDDPSAVVGRSTICIGSKAYQDEAVRRLLANCADGVAFLMYDGNWYQGGCEDPTHGHPVPFTKEDHCRANLELARRVHEKYPNVLIEMHDMMAGGASPRNTPVYYKYGLPGSYDLNWGFELMWDPMHDILTGQARSLYYYNLGCNVPLYLHIDLRKDRPGCVVLWWYASTCRHLGIGGTHADPTVVAAQKSAMRTYRALDRFFKRGEFYGINEEVHLHVLPEENAFVVNLFNLSDKNREIGGSIDLARMGLQAGRLKTSSEDVGTIDNGIWSIHRAMAPWSAQVVHVRMEP